MNLRPTSYLINYFGFTYENLARQDFQQREQIVSISEILEEVADIAAGLEREGEALLKHELDSMLLQCSFMHAQFLKDLT